MSEDAQNPPNEKGAGALKAGKEDTPPALEVPGPIAAGGPKISDDLPYEVMQHGLSFLDFADRQALTITNKRWLHEVETFSERLCMKIKEDHDVDQTFNERTDDQSKRTKQVKPVFRYRLSVSLKTWLYKIYVDIDVGKLLLSPSGRRLIIANRFSGAYRVFDFSTKQSTILDNAEQTTFTFSGQYFLEDDRMLTYTGSSLRIWTEESSETGISWSNNVIIQDMAQPGGAVSFFCRDDNFFILQQPFATANSANSSLMKIDLRDRSVVQTILPMEGFVKFPLFPVMFKEIYVATNGAGSWLLSIALRFIGGERKQGLQIYNLESRQLDQFLPGDHFRSLRQTSDCSKAFFLLRDGSVVLLELGDDGCLLERSSFPVTGSKIVAASTKHVVVASHDQMLHCYDGMTGQLNRTFGPNCFNLKCSVVISSTRKELLVGDDRTITAYCLEEPRL